MLFSKSLKFVEPETGEADPFSSAKSRLIQNLETQLKCAEAMVKGESYTVPVTKTVTGEDGTKKTVNVPHAPRHWYWRDRTGSVRFCVRLFNKRIELEAGKTDVLVGKDMELPKTVRAVIEAANAGEYDPQIKQALANRQKRKAS
jgi:hypothetical protein